MSDDDYEAHEAGELADMAMDELREKAQALADALRNAVTDIRNLQGQYHCVTGSTSCRGGDTALAAWDAK